MEEGKDSGQTCGIPPLKTCEKTSNNGNKMDIFTQNITLIKKFIHFLQNMDHWVYEQPKTHHSERPEPISLEQVNTIAVDFAKHELDDS